MEWSRLSCAKSMHVYTIRPSSCVICETDYDSKSLFPRHAARDKILTLIDGDPTEEPSRNASLSFSLYYALDVRSSHNP